MWHVLHAIWKIIFCTILTGLTVTPFIFASSFQTAIPEFEVVSIKPNNSGLDHMIIGGPGGCHGTDDNNKTGLALGRCLYRNVSARELINLVYGVLYQQEVRILDQPEWLDTLRFDLEGKAETPVPQNQLLLMLLDTLNTRFKLEAHHDTRMMDGFALVVGRNGHKLSNPQDPSVKERASLAINTKTRAARIIGENAPIALLVSRLEHGLRTLRPLDGKPLLDKTGLAGGYDFTLTWSETEGPSIFTAVQEQLGLRVESQRVPMDILVIDHIEKPSW